MEDAYEYSESLSGLRKALRSSSSLPTKGSLFESVVLIERSVGGDFQPVLRDRFPVQSRVPEAIDVLCFPDDGRDDFGDTETIVVTEASGRRMYGYHRKYKIRRRILSTCILSYERAYSLFDQVHFEEITTTEYKI